MLQGPLVLLGKLRPPRLGRVFGRERLFDDVDALIDCAGLWLSGPPGIGKTTLVATYLQARAVRCLWLQLDAGDADPATFVHGLLAAATAGAPQPGLHPIPPTADDLRDVPAFVRRSLRRLAQTLQGPWALVLDNVQDLGPAPALHAGLAAALAELPDGARVFAISREPPPDAYARALAGQQLALLDERALRFSDDDTRRLVALHGQQWPAADLQRATDGWPAAMVLLLASRSKRGPDEALRAGGVRSLLFAFFAGEVLAGMEAADTATLTRIAFLPSATAEMAVAVSGDVRAGDLLAGLARRSLFTDCREEPGAPPAYSFHALFSECLRARAAEQLDADALQALRLRAADVLAVHGHADAAIDQLIQAQAWPQALRLVLEQAARFVPQGRTGRVRDWLLALPEAERDTAPAWYWLGYVEAANDPQQALAHLERAGRAYAASADVAGAFCTAAAAADAIVFIGADLHAILPWMPALRAHAVEHLARQDALADLRVLPGLLAAFVHLETAHPLTATIAERAERLLDHPLGAGQRILLGTLAYYLLWTGQTARLDRVMAKVDHLCAESEAAAGTLLRWYGVSVLIRALLGRVDEALHHATQALALTAAGPAPMRAKAHLLLVLAAVAGRDAATARCHLDAAAGLLDAGNAIDATTYEFQRGLLMLLDADWTRADPLMRAAVGSGQASGWPLREHIALLGHTLAATQVGHLAEAQAALQQVLAHRFHAACRWHHWLAALIEAHLAGCLGERPRALDALRRAFGIGRDCGFDFGPMPFACGDMMPRLCLLALDHDIDVSFAQHIIRRHGLPAPPGAGPRWPWPVRIRTLGAFDIELDGVAATARKESRKPLDLLKLLLALGPAGGGPVPIERLSAALWPDAEGDAARNSFDNTLFRLRKLLGADRHLLLQAGALRLAGASCWTDLGELDGVLEGLSDGVSDGVGGHPEALLALADRALALYRGPFLAGEDELPPVQAARARIDGRFSRQMARAGAALQAAGRPADAARLYARVVELQPLAEDIHRQLITCLLVLGRRAEAFDAYRRCRQQLSVLLNLPPSAETEALIAPIRDL